MQKKTTKKGTFISKTDIGLVRKTNDDQACSLVNGHGDVFLCVFDGVGSTTGNLASTLAMNSFREAFRKVDAFRSLFVAKRWLKKLFIKTNALILSEAKKDNKSLETTFVCALIFKNKVIVANAGDSRCYFIGDSINMVSYDDTKVNHLFKENKIKESEIKTNSDRHVLTNAFGMFENIKFNISKFSGLPMGILLCSDGLYNNTTEKEIYFTLKTSDSPSQKIDTLISIANTNGGTDNIAISYWEESK